MLVVSPAYADLAREAVADNADAPDLSLDGSDARFADWNFAANGHPETPIADESAGTDLLYSSGTTGRPKGVMPPLPTGPIDAPTPLMRMGQALYGMGPDMIYLSSSPLYHAAPLRWAMAAQQLGGTVVVMERFEPETALALVERYPRVTHATFVPTHFVRMLKAARCRAELAMTCPRCARDPCRRPLSGACQAGDDRLAGPIVHEYYSGTECCGITALSSEEWLKRPGSVGRAVLGTLHILNEQAGNWRRARRAMSFQRRPGLFLSQRSRQDRRGA